MADIVFSVFVMFLVHFCLYKDFTENRIKILPGSFIMNAEI